MSESNAPSAVVDTNIFVSGTSNPHGRPRHVLLAWLADRFKLVLSEQQHGELTRVFERPKVARLFRLSPGEQTELIARLASTAFIVPSRSVPIEIRDPKDAYILAAAIGGNADYLVTGDIDLLVHQGDPRLGPLKIVTVAQFLSALEGSSTDTGSAS